MKKKDFKVISRKVLPALPEFIAKAQLLFMPPIRHLIRGVYFAQSLSARDFYVHVFIQPLVIPFDAIALSFGWRLRHLSGVDGWNADDPNLIPELLSGLQREALPFLSQVQSPRSRGNSA